jgi:predicted dehydrogenase
MIAAAKASRVTLSTYHNRHWDGSIMRALREIRKGVIGNVFRVEAHMGSHAQPGDWWRTSKSISGGILYDWGVHLLEYSLQILQADVLEVSGFATKGHWASRTRWKADTNEDEAFAVARLSGNKWLTLNITSIDALSKEADRGMLEITGTKGTYVMGYNDWRVVRPAKKSAATTSGKNPPSEGRRFYRNVANHILKGEKLVITPEWARRPIHILDLACRSAEQHRTLKARYR